MGTTRDALLANEGVQLGFVLCIEGYSYLLTNAADTSKVTTAWSGTLWSQALSGLQVSGQFEQSFKPFSNDLDVPTFSFRVLPDENDTFGKDVFKSKPDVLTRLTGAFNASHSTFDISVQSSGSFDSSGVVYIGNTAYSYSSLPTSTSIRVAANGAGYYAPFSTNVGSANRFPGQADLPASDNSASWEMTAPPMVSSSRRGFVGARVGLWAHRIVGGLWDTKAQAELIFAGTIEQITEAGDGATVVECAGIQSMIEDAVLLRDQWSARIPEGIYFVEGAAFDVWMAQQNSTAANTFTKANAKLTCVTGASGTAQFEPGRYTVDEISAIISDWLNNDSNLNAWNWDASVYSSEIGARFRLRGTRSTNIYSVSLRANNRSLLQFLGFSNGRIDQTNGYYHITEGPDGVGETIVEGDIPPVRTQAFTNIAQWATSEDPILQIESPEGTFFDGTSLLPPDAKQHASSGEAWSFFTINDSVLMLARKDSDTQLSGIRFYEGFDAISDGAWIPSTRLDASAPVIKQVAILSGSFSVLMTKLLASVDGNGSNHATYDVLPWGARIPWELLGDNWLDSLSDLEQTNNESSLTVVLEKPTKLWDVVKADVLLRNAFLAWKDGGLQMASLQTPNASNADWTLTENNKAVEAGADPRIATSHTSEMLVNNVKIEYNREPFSDKYRDTYIARDIASIEDYGLSRPLTIKARNSYSAEAGNGESIEALADMVTARFLPAFSRPVRRWRRSIAHTLFMAAPGDTVALTDNWARSPTTGARGVSARACTVLGISWSLGVSEGSHTYNGTIDLLYTEEDRMFPMSPSAKHRDYTGGSFTNGWDSGNLRLAVEDQEYALAADSNDASHFAVSDAVRVIEVDPANPASADTFTDVVAAVDSSGTPNYIQLTTGFGAGGNPAFSSSKTYIVVSDSYSSAGSSQQLEAYMSAEGDGLIEDTIEPNIYGDDRILGFASADITALPERHAAEWYGDGAPVHPHLLQAQARMLNNLVQHRCLSQMGFHYMIGGSELTRAVTGTYALIWTFPLFINFGQFWGGGERKLEVAPQFRSGSGASVTVRVTSSENPPSSDNSSNAWEDVTWRGTKHQVTFSTTSTTQWTIPSGSALQVARDPRNRDLTWISVEVTNNTGFVGLAELRWQTLA